jgi:hypothetical protein
MASGKPIFLIERSEKQMVEITVTVNYSGKDYQTNVIVDGRAKKEEVLRLAREQVRRQWRQ